MNAFTIDLEEWFHLLECEVTPRQQDWPELESRVSEATEGLLNILELADVRCTFFVLGWVAEHHPELVRQLHAAGHEIASHGYSHELVSKLSLTEFRNDLIRSREAIHSACGKWPQGYRAPGFSITSSMKDALQTIKDVGFTYDSSLLAARHSHGGGALPTPQPHRLACGLIEVPVSNLRLLPGLQMPFGGGYLRLLPSTLLRREAKRIDRSSDPLIVYAHPRDFDVGQPRLELSPLRQFRSYVGLASMTKKLRTLLDVGSFGTMLNVIESMRLDAGNRTTAN